MSHHDGQHLVVQDHDTRRVRWVVDHDTRRVRWVLDHDTRRDLFSMYTTMVLTATSLISTQIMKLNQGGQTPIFLLAKHKHKSIQKPTTITLITQAPGASKFHLGISPLGISSYPSLKNTWYYELWLDVFNHSSDITDFKDQKFVYGRMPTYTETCNIIGLRDQFAITDSSHRFWVYPKRAASGTKRKFLGVVYVKCSLFHQLNADWTLKCIIVQRWINVF